MNNVYEFPASKANYPRNYLRMVGFKSAEEWRLIDHLNPKFVLKTTNERTLISVPSFVAVHRLKKIVHVFNFKESLPGIDDQIMRYKSSLDAVIIRNSLRAAGHDIEDVRSTIIVKDRLSEDDVVIDMDHMAKYIEGMLKIVHSVREFTEATSEEITIMFFDFAIYPTKEDKKSQYYKTFKV